MVALVLFLEVLTDVLLIAGFCKSQGTQRTGILNSPHYLIKISLYKFLVK